MYYNYLSIYLYRYLNKYAQSHYQHITPAKIAGLKLSGKSPVDLRTPPLTIKIMLDPLKSITLVGRLGVKGPAEFEIRRPHRQSFVHS